MLKMIRMVPAASEVIEAARGRFWRLKAFFEAVVLLEVQWENCYTTWIYNFVAF